MEYKYEIGYKFYLQPVKDVFQRAEIVDRKVIEYETRPSKAFYYLDIEDRKSDWYTESFIDACGITEQKVINRVKGDMYVRDRFIKRNSV